MKIEFSPNTPIYIQVMEYIKEIVTGHLLPGDKIPSVRELASELQVNPNTIQRTFQELERDGVVVTRRGMGRYVTNEGEKIMELRKEMAKELLHSFIDGMDNLGFQKKKFLQFFVLHYMIRGRKPMTELLKIENLWKRYGLKAVIRELNIEITEGKSLGLLEITGAENDVIENDCRLATPF